MQFPCDFKRFFPFNLAFSRFPNCFGMHCRARRSFLYVFFFFCSLPFESRAPPFQFGPCRSSPIQCRDTPSHCGLTILLAPFLLFLGPRPLPPPPTWVQGIVKRSPRVFLYRPLHMMLRRLHVFPCLQNFRCLLNMILLFSSLWPSQCKGRLSAAFDHVVLSSLMDPTTFSFSAQDLFFFFLRAAAPSQVTFPVFLR